MKKISFTVLFLLLSNTISNAQTQGDTDNLCVKYSVFLTNENETEMYTPLIADIKTKLKEVTFGLKINNTESTFELNETNSLSKDNVRSILDMADMLGNKCYYTQNLNASLIETSDFLIEYPTKTNWIITSETKYIKGHQCYKAICTLEKLDPDDTYYDAYTLTAWFTNDIPFSFGPNCHGNLPGLILRLEQSILTFEMINIEKCNYDLSSKTSKKTINLKEYYDIISD